MINSGDEQKHLNFGNNSGDIFIDLNILKKKLKFR
jgi:hypothetical protein